MISELQSETYDTNLAEVAVNSHIEVIKKNWRAILSESLADFKNDNCWKETYGEYLMDVKS